MPVSTGTFPLSGTTYPTRSRYRFQTTSFVILLAIFTGIALERTPILSAYSRLYPGTQIAGVSVGGLTRSQAHAILITHAPQHSLKLVLPSDEITLPLKETGITLDIERTLSQAASQNSSPFTLISLPTSLNAPTLSTSIQVDEARLQQKAQELTEAYSHQPVNATLSLKDGQVTVTPEKNGYTLEASVVANTIRQAVVANSSRVILPFSTHSATISVQDLTSAQQEAEKVLTTTILLTSGNQTYRPTPSEIGTWLTLNGVGRETKVTPSKTKVDQYVQSIAKQLNIAKVDHHITLKDGKETARVNGKDGSMVNEALLSERIVASLTNKTSLTLDIPLEPVKAATIYKKTTTPVQVASNSTSTVAYKYCVRLRGVDASHLSEFSQKLSAVYANSQGWSLGGKLSFSQVESGCNYTAWLSAAEQMTSFGGACGSDYSCRSGNNVVINFDRWRSMTPAWNSSLDAYRTMVINHETGHWLGFGHRYCAGSGQAAPVMQQQSISLQGCTANPWPSSAERSKAAGDRGIVLSSIASLFGNELREYRPYSESE